MLNRKKATRSEAQALDQEAMRIIAEVKSGWLRLGLLIDKMIETCAFEVLGFPSMHAWMQARFGDSLASAYSDLRSVRKLKATPEEKLNRIGERNAHALTHLSERDRTSDEWIEKATLLPTREFKREVENKTGLVREKLMPFVILLPEAVHESLCQAEKRIASTLGVDIETKPGNRIFVWEAVSQWILQTDVETIKVQTEGVA